MQKLYKALLSCMFLAMVSLAQAQQAVPFVHEFSSEESLSAFTSTDSNLDGMTWTWDAVYQSAVSKYADMGSANDWLISPSIALKAGETYTVEYQMQAYTNNGESIGIFIGQGTTPAELKTTIMATSEQEISTQTWIPVSQEFTVAEDGNYNIGLRHSTSSMFFGGALYVKSMKVTGPETTVETVTPAAPTLTLTVLSEVAPYSVNVKVKTPTVDTNGNTLAGLKKVEVLRDDKIILTMNDPYTGSSVRTDDENIPEGKHVYTAYVYSLDGTKSEAATKEVTFGNAVEKVTPAAPTLTLTVLSEVAPYSVNVKVKTPTVDTDGNTLAGLKKVEVLRDDKVILSMDDPYTGSSVRTDDENIPEGKHVYTAYVYSLDGTKSEAATKEVTFGTPDTKVTPAAPTLTLTVLSEVAPYSVNVKVKTPSVDVDGNNLAGLKKVEVLRDDKVILSMDDPYTGSSVRTDDENIPEGKHVYTAYVYSLDGTKSEAATKEITFGGTVETVTPAAPTLTLTVLSEVAPYSVNVKVKTPTVDTNGNTLAGLKKVEVLRDDKVILSMDDPYTGSSVRTDDENIPEGKHVYTAYVYSLDGTKSEAATKEVTFGTPEEKDGVPAAVSEVTAVYNPETHKSTITWTAVTKDVDGNDLTQPVTYSVRRKGADNPFTTTCEATTYVDEVEMDGQVSSAYYIAAINATGKSSEKKSNDVMIGTAYEMPWAESAPNGQFTNAWAIGRTGSSRWGASDMGTMSFDGDRGYITFCPLADGDASSLTSGYIKVEGAANPVLRFHYFYVMPNSDEFYVNLIDENGKSVRAWEFDYESFDNSERWMDVSVPVREFLPECKYVQISFNAMLAVATQPILYIDDITLADKRDNDMAATLIKSPRNLKPGETRSAIVRLDNLGATKVEAGAATLKAMAGDKCIAQMEVPAINAGKRKDVTMDDLYLDVFTQTDSVELTFVVEYAGDEFTENNTTDAVMVEVKPVYVAAPTDVTLTDGILQWFAPEQPTVESTTYTESFEDAPSFTISDFGEWSLYDGINSSVYGLSDADGDISFPHTSDPQAWTVIDYATGLFNSTMQPTTGDKLLAAFSHPGVTEDSWVISPELSGQAQTIKFMAKALAAAYRESFKISYTTQANMALSSFVDLDDSQTILTNAWKEYSFDLPAGARYFAIRATSKDALCQLIDDITFVPEALGQPNTRIQGFNIYCDGVKINDSLVNDNQAKVEPGHTYNVTAVYATGESAPSADATLVDGIMAIDSADANAPQYTVTGVRVNNNYRGIVIRGGKKVIR